jgi:NhaP-type Na+/H+ and K+/H+ antiporter
MTGIEWLAFVIVPVGVVVQGAGFAWAARHLIP